MKRKKVKKYAKKLKSEGQVAFICKGMLYHIFESSVEDGYMVNVGDPFDMDSGVVDGGLCTGSEADAVEFMLPHKE